MRTLLAIFIGCLLCLTSRADSFPAGAQLQTFTQWKSEVIGIKDPGNAATNYSLILYPYNYDPATTNPPTIAVYHHGYGGTQFSPTYVNISNFTAALLSNNCYVVSSLAGYNQWNSDAGLKYYQPLIDWMLVHRPNNKKVFIWGASMGGSFSLTDVLYRTNCIGAYIVDPVCDLSNMVTGQYSNSIALAYGFGAATNIPALYKSWTNTSQYAPYGHNPAWWPSNVWTGVRLRIDDSPQDTTVPQQYNAFVLMSNAAPVAAECSYIAHIKAHQDPSAYDAVHTADFIAFFYRCFYQTNSP